MNKKFILLMTLMLLIGFAAKEVYAATIKFGEYKDLNEFINSIVSNLSGNGNYMKGIIELIGYLLGPFLLIYFLVEGILMEINFFSNNEKYNSIIAFAMALIAMAGGVSLVVARYIAEYGVLAILTFFAAVLVLGLSFYYRKKAREYGFFLGSQMLTHLIVHSPLILTTTIVGYYVIPIIGITAPANVGVGVFLLFLSAIIAYILHDRGFYNQQGWKKIVGWVVIGLGIVGAGMVIANIGFVKNFVQNTKSLFGATIGAAFGLMISVLNRHAAAHEVIARAMKNEKDMYDALNALHALKKHLLSKMNEGGITRNDISNATLEVIKKVLKVDIDSFFTGVKENEPLDPQVANKLLDEIERWIKDVERMMEYDFMTAEHALIKEHQKRVSSTS